MAGTDMQEKPNHKKKRLANIELLRILAMMMVVMLHYLSKGKVLPALTGSMDGTGYAAWILETLSIVAVNVYMLISGFFLVESGFKCRRLVQLLLQVLFYSLLVPLCLTAAGILDMGGITVYQLLQYVLPVQMLQYWFATAYVIMYLFSPLLGMAVRHMSKKQLQVTLGLLLLLLSVGKSILPVQLEMDNLGYDAVWFLCVYLTAAYIRLYGIPLFKNGRISAGLYAAGCAAIFGVTMLVRFVYLRTGSLEYFINAAYGYNHILNLFAAAALFYAFTYLKIPEGKLSRLFCRIGPLTFGVYLLHEQVELRYLWPGWLGAGTVNNWLLFVLHAIACVLIVFTVGILADLLRSLIFKGAGRLLKRTPPARWIGRIDEAMTQAEEKEG